MKLGEIALKKLRKLAIATSVLSAVCSVAVPATHAREPGEPENYKRKILPWGDRTPLYDTGGFILEGEADDPIYDIISGPDTVVYGKMVRSLKDIIKRAEKLSKDETYRINQGDKVPTSQEFNLTQLQTFMGALSASADPDYRFTDSPDIYNDILRGIEKFPEGSAMRRLIGSYVSDLATHDLSVARKLKAIYPDINWETQGIVRNTAKWRWANKLQTYGKNGGLWQKRSVQGKIYAREKPIEYQITDGLNARIAMTDLYASAISGNLYRYTRVGAGAAEMKMTPEAREYLNREYLSVVRENFFKGMDDNRDFLPFMAISAVSQDARQIFNGPTPVRNKTFQNLQQSVRQSLNFMESDSRQAIDSYDVNVYTNEIQEVTRAAAETMEAIRAQMNRTSVIMNPKSVAGKKFHKALEEITVAVNNPCPDAPLQRFLEQRNNDGGLSIG